VRQFYGDTEPASLFWIPSEKNRWYPKKTN